MCTAPQRHAMSILSMRPHKLGGSRCREQVGSSGVAVSSSRCDRPELILRALEETMKHASAAIGVGLLFALVVVLAQGACATHQDGTPGASTVGRDGGAPATGGDDASVDPTGDF